ncbi:MAG: F0F1 ATP synthase subunit delta [Sphingomonadaceae bacterium]|nr:F0F1 ATP synthase subunit delta [Sphingomonadaceae bacterium]
MENSGAIQASLAGRYASALFDLARDGKGIDAVAASLTTLDSALGESTDLRRLFGSPLVSRDAAANAVKAVSGSLKLDPLTTNFLGVLAANRRLGQAGAVIAAFRQLAAAHRGEMTADVTSAHALTDGQVTALKSKLKARVGRDVAVNLRTDSALLGGLVVRLGSQLIDGSIRTRLNTLAHAMKG